MKVSSVINIHLRPNIHKLLVHQIAKDIFIKYCKDNYAGESIDCYLLIQDYKQLINEHVIEKEDSNNNSDVYDENVGRNSMERAPQEQQSSQPQPQPQLPLPKDEEEQGDKKVKEVNAKENTKEASESVNDGEEKEEEEKKKMIVTIDTTESYHKINELLQNAIKQYIKEGSEHEINIDSQTRSITIKKIETFTKEIQENTQNNSNTTKPLLTFTKEEINNLFDEVEFQILLMLNGDILPRFVRSEQWHEFISLNSDIATECCSLEDLELLKNLRYTKEDFKRRTVTMKDIQFADMVCLDYSCFEYLAGSKDINVYFCSGDTFFEDLGIGKSNVAKTIGYLPFSAEVVISCVRDSFAVKKIYPTTVFETNENGEEMNGYDATQEMVVNTVEKTLPSDFSKYHVKIGGLFDLRTNYVCSSVIYKNLKYYFITKGIYDPESNPNEYIYYKNGKRKCKSTVPMVSISIHVITPISKDKCHYIHFASGNIGGVFSKITTLSVFKKLLGKVSVKSRETLISVLNEFKQEKYVNIKEGYERTKKTINCFNKAYGIVKDCPFPKTFEEFQEL